MSGSHTPTPWKVSPGHAEGAVTVRQDGGEFQRPVAEVWHNGDDPKANAEFIVTAVNSYASSQAEIERLRAENATLRAAATKIDADWTEAFPDGPDGNRKYLGGFGTLSDDTAEVWRVIRAALSRSKE